MNETLFLVIFVVVFYFVFRTIWRNVTTVSYNGLSGFINSWWSQVLWAVFITTIISMIICGILDKNGIKYEKLYADENVELVTEYGIKQAPTLIVTNTNPIEKYTGVSDIKKYFEL